jgi:hypothetical protein
MSQIEFNSFNDYIYVFLRWQLTKNVRLALFLTLKQFRACFEKNKINARRLLMWK